MEIVFIWQEIIMRFGMDYCPRQRYNLHKNCSDRILIAYSCQTDRTKSWLVLLEGFLFQTTMLRRTTKMFSFDYISLASWAYRFSYTYSYFKNCSCEEYETYSRNYYYISLYLLNALVLGNFCAYLIPTLLALSRFSLLFHTCHFVFNSSSFYLSKWQGVFTSINIIMTIFENIHFCFYNFHSLFAAFNHTNEHNLKFTFIDISPNCYLACQFACRRVLDFLISLSYFYFCFMSSVSLYFYHNFVMYSLSFDLQTYINLLAYFWVISERKNCLYCFSSNFQQIVYILIKLLLSMAKTWNLSIAAGITKITKNVENSSKCRDIQLGAWN